jgi:hypothetical protein
LKIELENKASTREIVCQLQNYIETPPVAKDRLYDQSCSNDKTTVEHWRVTWIGNVKANHAKYGPWKNHHIGALWGKYYMKPCIVAGAGPSLKRNGKYLKDRGDIPLISCLHNFHFMIDNEIKVDYLDAGDVTVEEVYEGGKQSPDFYWEKTKDNTLLAYIGTSPLLLEKWQGPVMFFNCPVPDPEYTKAVEDLEIFNTSINTGGNVLGACTYIAKAFCGANPIVFMGADFSFGYDNKFHGWDSKYDSKMGNVLKTVDIFGNKVLTWPSYNNFKCWFDWLCITIPGLYINCTDGGTLGAYMDGNIMSVIQMPITHLINMYHMHDHMKDQSIDTQAEKTLLF